MSGKIKRKFIEILEKRAYKKHISVRGLIIYDLCVFAEFFLLMEYLHILVPGFLDAAISLVKYCVSADQPSKGYAILLTFLLLLAIILAIILILSPSLRCDYSLEKGTYKPDTDTPKSSKNMSNVFFRILYDLCLLVCLFFLIKYILPTV